MPPSRQYEQLSQFERGRIIGIMETGWSARQVALHLRLSDFTWIVTERNQVSFSDESKFNLGSDDNRVQVWRLCGEHLNNAFAVQQHTTPTTSMIVWGFIAYTTWSPLIFIHCTMTAQRTILKYASKSFTELSPPHFHPFMACLITRIVTDREYLGTFRMASWTAYEFFRIRGTFTATVEQDVAEYHTRLVCLNARPYHINHSCYR
ncbi:transposable element Tcb1 transposase [Trichonephila clavipes]|nr:transposable element Tcb1 transposase [Trichonephila clavipes]